MGKSGSGSFMGLHASWVVLQVNSHIQPTRCEGTITIGGTTLNFSPFLRWCGNAGWSQSEAKFLMAQIGAPLSDSVFSTQMYAGNRVRRNRESHHGEVPHIPEHDVAILSRVHRTLATDEIGQASRNGPNDQGTVHLKSTSSVDLITDAYPRITSEQHQLIERRHNALSNCFKTWLAEVGASEIRIEHGAVDVRCIFARLDYLFELKTCTQHFGTRHAIREALGQALDYSLYPNRVKPDHLAILLDVVPTSDDKAWIRRLVAEGIAVELFWLVDEEVYAMRATKNAMARKALIAK